MNEKRLKKVVYYIFIPLIFFLSSYSIHATLKLKEYNQKFKSIKKRVSHMEKQMEEMEKKFLYVDFLKFKADALDKRYPEYSKIVDIVYKKSREYGFSPELVLSIIYIESSFNPKAVSPVGAYGLMQINYSVWKDELKIDFNKIFDIEYNIDLGLKILRQYYNKSNGNIMKALFLYNNGYKYENYSYNKKVFSSIFLN